MADKPIKQPLTVDLPIDWKLGQIVAPDGVEVGLTDQHGYNYLMQQVNEARTAINSLNEFFEQVASKEEMRKAIFFKE